VEEDGADLLAAGLDGFGALGAGLAAQAALQGDGQAERPAEALDGEHELGLPVRVRSLLGAFAGVAGEVHGQFGEVGQELVLSFGPVRRREHEQIENISGADCQGFSTRSEPPAPRPHAPASALQSASASTARPSLLNLSRSMTTRPAVMLW
jgi:hypothetical protein